MLLLLFFMYIKNEESMLDNENNANGNFILFSHFIKGAIIIGAMAKKKWKVIFIFIVHAQQKRKI